MLDGPRVVGEELPQILPVPTSRQRIVERESGLTR